ncbi:MAG: hypothetical protein CL503_03115, partial [Actinobacteria bacterium]|nr:hypothetical protein [Actinomycetota bacterium]
HLDKFAPLLNSSWLEIDHSKSKLGNFSPIFIMLKLLSIVFLWNYTRKYVKKQIFLLKLRSKNNRF